MNKSRLLSLAYIFLLSISLYEYANATSVPAITTTPNLGTSGTPGTFGWSFIPNTDIFVTHLGVATINGLREVALWDSSSNLLASTVVASSDAVIDDYRYSQITTTKLDAGVEYTLGVFWPSFTPIGDGNSTFISVPELGVTGGKFTLSPTIEMPTTLLNSLAVYVGPNMLITTVPIPPAIWLFGSGMLGLIGIARKKAF